MLLLSTPVGCPPTLLSGFGAVPTKSEPLAKLQQALVKLSEATRNSAINPGRTDGALTNGLPDDRTMLAITAALGLITPHIPKVAAASLVIALGIGASTTTAKKAVLDFANELRTAVNAATAAAPFYVKPPPTETPPVPPKTPTTPTLPKTPPLPDIFKSSGPWYTTWWGIGAAFAVGLLGTLALIRARRASVA